MFNNLTEKLQEALRKLRGQARLTEANMSEAMADIREALLDADVNLQVVKEFVESVSKDCLGTDVLKSVTPGQQAIKIVYDRLVELMGDSESPLQVSKPPSAVMMVGLHGSGKTTTTAKLALRMKKAGKKVMLVAGDIYRPAAIDQLEVLANDIAVPVYVDRMNPDVSAIVRDALDRARREAIDILFIDTAGRLQIDAQMVQELVRVSQVANPSEILLVADAALGQEAVSVSDHFHKALGLTGVVLTKLDGDARGGAALSIRKVTGCPIKFVGVGEKIEDIEPFYPDRMASRILGMGDVVSLVEKAAEEIDRDEAMKLQEKLKKNSFDFNDFLGQLRQMSKLGGVESILKMLPGGNQLAGMSDFDPKQFVQMEAIICSMTKAEREEPDIIDFSRRKRIAKGSGTKVEQVSQLINQFTMMRKMMKRTSLIQRLMSGGGLPPAGGAGRPGGGFGGRGPNRMPSKKKKRRK